MLQAIILLGGLGSRISRLFPDRPKALIPVAGQPFLERQIDWLSSLGIANIHLAAGHLAEAISAWAQARRADKLQLTHSAEPRPLGTAGGLKFIEAHVQSNPFLLLNGDSLLPKLDLAALQLAQRRGGGLATLALAQVATAQRYGAISCDAQDRINAFHEKSSAAAGWVNAGVYLMSKAIFGWIEPDKKLALETDIFPRLAAQRLLTACRVPEPLLDMGTPAGLANMERYFKNAPPKKTGRRLD